MGWLLFLWFSLVLIDSGMPDVHGKPLVPGKLRPVLHLRQHAQHFIEQVCTDQRRVAGRVVRRRNLHQVAPDNIQPTAAADDFKRLPDRQAADFRRAGARSKARVQAVDVEAQVHRAIAQFRAHLVHDRRDRLVPALLRLHDTDAVRARPVEGLGRIAGAAQADLRDAVAVDQSFFYRPPKRRAVSDLLAEHGVVHVRMRVDMNHAARVAMLYGRSRPDSARIARGPKRAPARFDVPVSSGTPTKHASSPSAEVGVGRRIILARPPKRGIWLPPSGWLNGLSEWLSCFIANPFKQPG